MPRHVPSHSRVDYLLRKLQQRGTRRGIYGSSRSRVWFWIAIGAWGFRQFRKASGAVPSLVYRGELQPGETITVSHKPETFAGKRVRSRRRTPVS